MLNKQMKIITYNVNGIRAAILPDAMHSDHCQAVLELR
jgi:exonuclease III